MFEYNLRVSCQVSKVKSQMAKVRFQKSDVKSQMSKVGCQMSDVKSHLPNVWFQFWCGHLSLSYKFDHQVLSRYLHQPESQGYEVYLSPKAEICKYLPQGILCRSTKARKVLTPCPKILNSMKKTHFHFVLHRLIKDRNRYTVGCYKDGRKPVLPSAKFATKDE